ncbi:hypothetical protein [Mycobacterium lepromatosis]|uniref:hypothetical protein n=1 Tax=Mycobacterium lepromatosis TaxID=480418 RepID=UPI000B173BCB|nr:hypothetical protein [Mycobacterium lepromatosis]
MTVTTIAAIAGNIPSDQRRLRKLEDLSQVITCVIAQDKSNAVLVRVRNALLARGWKA